MNDTITISAETYYPWQLARMAGAGTNITEGSPGSTWLLDVAGTYKVEREDIRGSDEPSDYLSDLADSAPPVSTHEQWEVFADLQLYQFDSDLLGETSARSFLNDGPGTLLYEVASNLLHALYQDHDSGE